MDIKTELESKLEKHKKQQRLATQISLVFGLTGAIMFAPILSDKDFVDKVQFCVTNRVCKAENVLTSTVSAFNKENQNQYFAENVKVKRYIPSQDNRAIGLSVVGSILLMSAFGVNKLQTNRFKRAIHLEYTSIKVEAIRNNAVAKAEISLAEISQLSKVSITQFAIEQRTQDTINGLKSDGQVNYEMVTGSRLGEVEAQLHLLKLAQLNKERLEVELASKELKEKIEASPDSKDSKKEDKNLIKLTGEHVWINRALNEPFKVVTGVSGSGKSTLEHLFIQLARQSGQFVIAIYPNTTRKAKEGGKVLSDPDEINNFLAGFTDLIVSRQKECAKLGLDEDDYLEYSGKQTGEKGRIAIFAMEVNNWEARGVDPLLIAEFYRLCLTDVRKWGVTLTATGQSINQGAVASKLQSFSKLLGKQTIIECQATIDPVSGESISKGTAMVKFSDDKEPIERKLYFFKPQDKSKY